MKEYNQIIGLIALSSIKGIGPAFIKKYIHANSFTSEDIIEELGDILRSAKKNMDTDELFFQVEDAKKIHLQSSEESIKMIPFNSDDYPKLLKELKDPPPVIYCKGNLELLHNKTICLIGTREPNLNGCKIAERVGSYFNINNWSICNGLAEGIDTFSITTNGNFHKNVIGIVAGGLNYNSTKTLLNKTAINAENILNNNGLLISEMAISKKEDTFSVVKSCRIQAGMSAGLILIQSDENGGSKYTLKSFVELKRPLSTIKPVAEDEENESYSANKNIILKGKKGLAEMLGLKEEKINTDKIVIIKSKADYSVLESLMHEVYSRWENNNSIF